MKLRVLSLVLLIALAVFPRTGAAESITLQNAYNAALQSYETVKISEENVIQGDSRVDQARPSHGRSFQELLHKA